MCKKTLLAKMSTNSCQEKKNPKTFEHVNMQIHKPTSAGCCSPGLRRTAALPLTRSAGWIWGALRSPAENLRRQTSAETWTDGSLHLLSSCHVRIFYFFLNLYLQYMKQLISYRCAMTWSVCSSDLDLNEEMWGIMCASTATLSRSWLRKVYAL